MVRIVKLHTERAKEYECGLCFVFRFPLGFGVVLSTHIPLQWRHNERDSVSDHQNHDKLNRLFRRRSKKTLKLRVTDLCVGNSPVTGEFPAQRASNVENISIWWRRHKNSRYQVVFTFSLNYCVVYVSFKMSNTIFREKTYNHPLSMIGILSRL